LSNDACDDRDNETVRDWVKENYLPKATDEQIDDLLNEYPDKPAEGSPFDTGDARVLVPQWKRLSALQGDLVFQAPRRNFMKAVHENGGQVWGFRKLSIQTPSCYFSALSVTSTVSKRNKNNALLPRMEFLGAVSAKDTCQVSVTNQCHT
jgi:hypothetical protein